MQTCYDVYQSFMNTYFNIGSENFQKKFWIVFYSYNYTDFSIRITDGQTNLFYL